ncbi:MAG: bile acid:sodium symporter, partial [Pirellulaceae bacterium]
STLAQCGILSIVFLGAIKAGDLLLESADTGSLPVTALAVSIAFVIIVHSVMFWFGYGCGALIRLPRADQIAVAFSGSQKTLMVGLYLCDLLECIAIPMIAFHVCQLFIDTLFADRLNRSGQIDPNDRPREQQHKHSPSSGGEDADKGEDMFSDLE